MAAEGKEKSIRVIQIKACILNMICCCIMRIWY